MSMADVVKIAESKIQELADAVRTYVGSSDSYTLADMPDAINPRYVYISGGDTVWNGTVKVPSSATTWADLITAYPDRFYNQNGLVYQSGKGAVNGTVVCSDVRVRNSVSTTADITIGNTYYVRYSSGGGAD